MSEDNKPAESEVPTGETSPDQDEYKPKIDSNQAGASEGYGEGAITILEGLEAVRKRPGLPDQVILQIDQVLFEIAGEAHHLKAIPLSVARLLEGLVQIVEVDQLGP